MTEEIPKEWKKVKTSKKKYRADFIHISDVKEFIKRLKEATKVRIKWYRLGFHRFIEELAGDKLK